MLHAAVVLDAAMTVDEALSRLQEHRADARVVLRRQAELRLFYYVFWVDALKAMLKAGLAACDPPGASVMVGNVLDLNLLRPAPTFDPAALRESRRHHASAGVLIDGTHILGVWELDERRLGGGASPPSDTAMIARPRPRNFLEGLRDMDVGLPRAPVPPAPAQSPPPPSAPPPAQSGPPPAEPAPAPVAPLSRRDGDERLRLRNEDRVFKRRDVALPGLPDLFKKRRENARGAGKPEPKEPVAAAPPAAAAPRPAAVAAQPVTAAAPLQFRAHPRLELESDVIAPGARFDLTIGLSREAVANVTGTAVTAELPSGTIEFDLDIQLVADGFEAPAGWFFRLRVPVAEPERAQLQIPLIAPNDAITRLTVLEVHFSYRGSPCGVAFRKIAVQPLATATVEAPSGGQPWIETASAGEIVLDTSEPPADLWITISKPDGNDATGKYSWTFKSPHPVKLPEQALEIDLGSDARTFAEKMIKSVTRAEGTPLIDQALAAVGRQVRDKAPPDLEDVLRAVWTHVNAGTARVPTLLLQTAEPHVPWELARLNDAPDPNQPPYLGAQFTVGRWIFGARGVSVPPAREIPVRAMAVVAGDYRSSLNHRPLLKAEAEGEELSRRWGALRLKATVEDMNALLEGGLEQNGTWIGGAEAIHFACHGEVDPRNPQDAMIYLDNDWPLEASLFLEAPVGRSHQPFLFLNACQVGQSGELLGDYAGFAGFCLRSGFRGFVAPLWSVSDEIAHEIALQFYDATFSAEPVPVAEVLRQVRCRYPVSEKVPPSTWLAYVFYGHPACILKRA